MPVPPWPSAHVVRCVGISSEPPRTPDPNLERVPGTKFGASRYVRSPSYGSLLTARSAGTRYAS